MSKHIVGPDMTARGDGIIPLCVPEIRGKEWEYVKECLDSNWVSSVGPFVEVFERKVAELVGARYAVATDSGTAALHVAVLLAGIAADDEVLVSTLSFIAPANAVRYAGAWPVFVDAEPEYWQMDPEKAVDFLEKGCEWRRGALYNKVSGRRLKAILPVHVLGHPCDVDPILEAARKYDLAVIEDAAESHGARYKGRSVGHLGDIGCFSFNGNKIVTAGGGGVVVTDNEDWARKAKYLTTQAKDDPVEYVHHEIGYNYRLTNLQAALGCAQLEQLDAYMVEKRRIAARYREAFRELCGIDSMREAPWALSIFWLYTILVDESQYGMDSRVLLRRLGEAGIQARPLWQPLHLSKVHAGAQATDCSVAERLNRQALSLPSSVGLSAADQQRVIDVICNSAAGT
ncbi:MAG: LegC family aminotransferase [Gemmatimonadetes bacterium]|nr:LegC family aminotransferase [Gemmatimonadota bacterium]